MLHPTPPPERVENDSLASEIISQMDRITWDRIGAMSLENARLNASTHHGKSIADLRTEVLGTGDSAVVMASGPSNKRHDPIQAIKASGYKGALIAPESGIRYLLSNDVIPDLIVTVDPHPTRTVRLFGDPLLNEDMLAADDYYSRQDMDEAFASELETNRQVIKLLEKHGKKMRIAMATSSSSAVVQRVLDVGMEIYWWNPMLDDPDQENSITRELYRINGLPSVNCGGNVGTASWMISHAVLNKKHIALTGMDLSYYDGTPYRNTQYYDAMLKLVDEKELDSFFIRIYNPYVKAWFFTDPAYMWYRDAFLELSADADCSTYNCTEGGILFSDNVKCIPLASFLESHT